uniref:Uncharacterized protein n=1 Tax=Cacopsylla melanoneura TaxID=428564 RepID=A0A8D8PZ72_9HEMI
MNGTPLKRVEVDHFKYLGSIISEDGTFDKEINRRIQQGSAFYNKVQDLIWSSYVPLKCKRTLFKTYFVPIITYAAETWVMLRHCMKRKDEKNALCTKYDRENKKRSYIWQHCLVSVSVLLLM